MEDYVTLIYLVPEVIIILDNIKKLRTCLKLGGRLC